MDNKVKIAIMIAFVAVIVILEVLTNRCTKNFIGDTQKDLEDLRTALLEEDYDKSKEKSEELKNNWDKREDVLSYYIEHDELEKISSQIAIIAENCKNKEYKLALEDNMETDYLLEHVEDKLKLTMKNVF